MSNHEIRIDYPRVAPALVKSYYGFSMAVDGAGLEHSLLELVKLRASQLNNCAFCVDMHSKDARAHGEQEQRLYALPVWHETPFFSARERAALAWTEALTRLAGGGVSDELFAATREHFSEAELVQLTFMVVTINGWNRLGAAFRPVPGTYKAPTAPAPRAEQAG